MLLDKFFISYRNGIPLISLHWLERMHTQRRTLDIDSDTHRSYNKIFITNHAEDVHKT